MKYGKTAAYTILKNEISFIDKWLYYADPFDYKVLLDTGSTDGSWEYLQECAEKDPQLIIEQKIFDPWRFDVARKYNMTMIPKNVEWCLSPDLDEYFSINTHYEMENVIYQRPDVTNISCDRLDVYSIEVRVGPPTCLGTNKIHRKNDYTWVQPIYEHLSWIHKDRYECEFYSDKIFLIHDQDFRKKERPDLYIKMLKEEYEINPSNTWCLWFLVNHYYKNKELDEFIQTGCDFILYNENKVEEKYKIIFSVLSDIYNKEKITDEQKEKIKQTLR